MKLGCIDVCIMKILIVGPAGVGKSCLLNFLCGLDVPDTYNSTGCIETAQRLKCERVRIGNASDKIKWELVDSEKLKAILADAIKSRAGTLRSNNENGTDTQEVDYSVDTSLENNVDVIGLLGSEGGVLFSIKWIYLVDSGGQPQFHELLTAFVKNATLGIFVFNLSENLDKKPVIRYYKNGEQCGESYEFPLSHKEIFQHCVQTISTLYPTDCSTVPCDSSTASTTDTEKPIEPQILVVGTHRGQEDRFVESRDEKERKLREILKPYDDKVILYGNKDNCIFPIDSVVRAESDKAIRDRILDAILDHAERFCTKKLPLQYYALELELKEGRKIISFEECFQKFGSSLKFKGRMKFLAAIRYLDELNLILYFKAPDAFIKPEAPDLIFSNPNALLDKVSEIVEKSYNIRKCKPITLNLLSEGKSL